MKRSGMNVCCTLLLAFSSPRENIRACVVPAGIVPTRTPIATPATTTTDGQRNPSASPRTAKCCAERANMPTTKLRRGVSRGLQCLVGLSGWRGEKKQTMTTTCTTCGKAHEAGSEEQANETVRECHQCRIVAKLVAAQYAMKVAAGAMMREGGLYEDHGREMLGATRIIDGWFREMSEDSA